MNVYVPSLIIDEIPAINLDSRGRGEEWHEGREQALGDHEDKLLIAVLPTSKCAPISQHAVLILEFAVQ
jgi:hypothetical protein